MVEGQESQPSSGSASRVLLVLLVAAFLGLVAGIVFQARRMAGYETRLKELEEARRGPPAKRRAPPKPPAPADLRKREVERCRREYEEVIAAARKACGADEVSWKKAEGVLRLHFAPMEKALEAFEKSSGWRPPDARRVVGPHAAGALQELRALLDAESWKRFDAWRRPKPGTAGLWRQARYKYLLTPEEYREVEAAATAALRWNMAGGSIRKLRAELELPAHQEDEMEAVLRDHLARYSAAVGGLGAGARRPADSEEKVRAAIEDTEKKLKLLLGAEKLKAYLKWKASLAGPARGYFAGAPETVDSE